jgi:hypothetical protein
MIAYCWQSGQIEIGRELPQGALPLLTGTRKHLENRIESTATLAYDNKTWLVPGVRSAEKAEDKVQAVIEYVKFIGK